MTPLFLKNNLDVLRLSRLLTRAEVCGIIWVQSEGGIKMRIVKCEKIFLSQNEESIWIKFDEILEGLYRESENPDIVELVGEIRSLLVDLWDEVEEVE